MSEDSTHNMNMYKKTLCKIIFIFIFCCLCVSGIAQKTHALSDRFHGPDIDIAQLEKKIHDLINKERAKQGLPALSMDEGLRKVARKYSQDMVKRNFFSHKDPDGRSFHDRYKAGGVECSIRVANTTCIGAENIAQGNIYSSYLYKDGEKYFNWNTEDEIARAIVRQWIDSKGHRANILTPYFKQQGIGVAVSDDGKVYVTETFC